MAERFVYEDARQLVIENHRIGAASHPRRIEEVNRALRDDAESLLESLHATPAFAQTDRLEAFLDRAVAAADRWAGNHDLRAPLIQHGSFRIDVPTFRDFVPVARLCVDDRARDGEHRTVIGLEQLLLVAELDAAHIAIEIELGVGNLLGGLRQANRLVLPGGLGPP